MKTRRHFLKLAPILFLMLFCNYNKSFAQTLDATFSSPSTIECSGGMFTLSATNSGYQNYSWTITGPNTFTSNLSGSSTSINLTEPGTYNVSLSVTDGGITTNNSVSGYLSVDAPPTVNAGVDQVICANSFATLNGSVGGSATSISWSGGSGTFSPTNANLSAIYTPSASDIANGFVNLILTTNDPAGPCSAVSDTVMILFNSLPTVTAPAYFCEGSSAQLSPSSGGTWTSSNVTRATVNSSGIAVGLSAGNVTFTFTNTLTGCSNTTSTVTINSNPIFTLSNTDPTTCNGTNGTINILGLTPNTSYQYSYALSNISIGPITATSNSTGQITNSGLGAGTYALSVVNLASGCQSASQEITLINPNAPDINDIQDQVLCGTTYSLPAITGTNLPGNQAYYTGPNGTGSVISIGTVISTTSTIYMYTSTIGGCIDEESFTVTIHSQPTVTAPASLCVGSTEQLSPSSGGTWVSNNPLIATISSSGLVTGTAEGIASFSFTSTATGCSTTSSNLNVTANATVDPIPDQIICAGDSLTPISFSGSAQQYNWTNDNTNIGLGALGTGNISGFTAINNTVNNQVATITVTPISGSCNATPTTFTITVKPLPTVNPSADQILCNNDFNSPINFSGTNTDFTVFNWTNDNMGIGLSASGTGNIPSFQVQNINSVSLVANFIVTPSLNGCIGISDTFSIIVKPTPIIFPVPDQTVCAGESTSAIVFSGSSQITTYFWNQSVETIGLTSSNGTGNIPAFIAQNLFDIPLSSSFNVTPILEGCIGVPINFTITVLPIPIVNAGNDTILCAGQSYTPIANGTATSYSWINYSNGVAFIPPSSIMLTLNGELNGCIASDNVLLTVVSNPIASITTFDGEDSLACDGTLSVLVTDGTAPYSYTWTNGASSYTTSAIQDLCSGTYSLAVVDANGCSATNSATINDTLIENVLGDTLIFTDNIYQDSTIIGADTSAWIENCTFDYSLVTGATIDSYIDSGDSTIVTWIVALSTGSTVSVDATYYMSPGTSGVYNLTLQLFCSAKSGPKFLIASSRLYYEPSTIGVQSLSLNDVFLYPNPTWDKIFLQSSTNLIGQGYVITDFSGKIVQTDKINSEKQEINLENLKSGVYYIDMQNSSNKLKINKQ